MAQRSGKGPAFTSPPTDDPNYALLGEFAGAIKTGENQYEPLALQIRPIGGDQFEAISFWGGLPGQEKHKPEMTKMIGIRSGDYVVLSGGPWAIFVEKDHCLIVDRKGDKLGHLDRVERQSPTLGATPPAGALVLFDGTNVDQFVGARMTDDGLLMEGAEIRPMLQDFNMHVEFRLPYMPQATGQSRGNSGLYLQSRYECQVLDSFATEPVFDGCGALYRFKAPDLNMCLPPLVWQTYDIQFTAPRWASDGSKIRGAHITSWINGVKVQDNVSLPNKTGAGKEEAPLLLPIHIQNHGDPVRFRNMWVIDRGLTTVEFPVTKKDDPKPESPEKKSTEKQSAEKQKPSAASDKEDKKPDAKQEKPAEAKKDKAEAKPAETKPAAEKTFAPAKNDKAADEKAEAASK
ncbi:3-keto-disaccharide hydrolase [Stieleria varia]|nr:DUF1080 domain-containing protein [Stieleria varia]